MPEKLNEHVLPKLTPRAFFPLLPVASRLLPAFLIAFSQQFHFCNLAESFHSHRIPRPACNRRIDGLFSLLLISGSDHA